LRKFAVQNTSHALAPKSCRSARSRIWSKWFPRLHREPVRMLWRKRVSQGRCEPSEARSIRPAQPRVATAGNGIDGWTSDIKHTSCQRLRSLSTNNTPRPRHTRPIAAISIVYPMNELTQDVQNRRVFRDIFFSISSAVISNPEGSQNRISTPLSRRMSHGQTLTGKSRFTSRISSRFSRRMPPARRARRRNCSA
jgi:hypothetical protein